MGLLAFMLPTQAAGAIVLDGTPLIVLGSLVIVYYLYKNLHHVSNPLTGNVSNMEGDAVTSNKVDADDNKLTISFAHDVEDIGQKQDLDNLNNESLDKERVVNNHKQLVFNHK